MCLYRAAPRAKPNGTREEEDASDPHPAPCSIDSDLLGWLGAIIGSWSVDRLSCRAPLAIRRPSLCP